MILARRGFLSILAGAMTAPAIVRAASIMPVKAVSVLSAEAAEAELLKSWLRADWTQPLHFNCRCTVLANPRRVGNLWRVASVTDQTLSFRV